MQMEDFRRYRTPRTMGMSMNTTPGAGIVPIYPLKEYVFVVPKEGYPGLFPVLRYRSSLPTPRGPLLLAPAFGLNVTCRHVEP